MIFPSFTDLLTARTRLVTGLADGRVPDLLGLLLIASTDRCHVFPGDLVPDGIVRRAQALAAAETPARLETSGSRATLVDGCLALLRAELGQTRVEAGPIYWIDHDLPHAHVADVDLVTSTDPGGRAASCERPANWDEDEWNDLLAGRLGPWTMALAGNAVVSICHTPGLSSEAAECGTWTRPDFRGRGLAGATTAAWAQLVRGDGRLLFYSTDERNTPSQRVADRLGLRLIGRQWELDASPVATGDAWGRALLDQHRGVWVPTPDLETDTGELRDAMHPEWFFRSFEEWDWWERELLPLVGDGPALDLGAGAGRAALWLLERGAAVTAMDSSRDAVEVCRQRGVNNARIGDLVDPPTDQRWQTILLLGGNLGLAGSWANTQALLSRLAEISAPNAVVVADTVDPLGPSEIGLRIHYKGQATPWWRQLNVPIAEVARLVKGTGWRVERHLVDEPDHAVLLRRV